jgi:hypothetical protein
MSFVSAQFCFVIVCMTCLIHKVVAVSFLLACYDTVSLLHYLIGFLAEMNVNSRFEFVFVEL